ncbi:hypothetical protein FRC14_002982 [Serendipita sp. 396]|nr:hypothetical protein FRC14_002982 [Serendipita sp. 396]KAG8868094.1 hypothetical protein FRC20_004195 [Serendipita sp. 405]
MSSLVDRELSIRRARVRGRMSHTTCLTFTSTFHTFLSVNRYYLLIKFRTNRHQNNLAREPSTTRLIVQLADVRIIAIGTLGQVSSYQTNRLAKEFVHPSGIYPDGIVPLPSYDRLEPLSASSDTPQYYKIPITQKVGTPITRSLTLDETTSSTSTTTYSFWRRMRSGTFAARESVTYVDASTAVMGSMYRNLKPSPPTPRYYSRLTCPNPYYGHRNFPNFTLGGQDLRWPEAYDGTAEEVWVGPML